jgi:hypothetical protein
MKSKLSDCRAYRRTKEAGITLSWTMRDVGPHRLCGEIGNPNGFQLFKIGKPEKQSIQTNYGTCKKLKRLVWVKRKNIDA